MPIISHKVGIRVSDDVVLFRYMSFEKYKSLLETRALFFCRADEFKDLNEGSITQIEDRYNRSPEKFHYEEKLFGKTGSVFDQENANKNADAMLELHKKVKRATTVNCWHMNSFESEVMWQEYSQNNDGIAVRSNVFRLKKSFDASIEEIRISKVRYIDYSKDSWYDSDDFPIKENNIFTPIIHKSKELVKEQELRIYHHDINREDLGYWETQAFQKGELIKIDISTLVECVIFHPTASDEMKDKLKSVTKQYGFDFKFESSRLSVGLL
jgi:hypothetical protein